LKRERGHRGNMARGERKRILIPDEHCDVQAALASSGDDIGELPLAFLPGLALDAWPTEGQWKGPLLLEIT